ncbi:hypothetical protein Barb7_01914 [Bacteroidales bacterium Barb7]|nr:hypothetical protein Barb7_01914 [Bacteroidales bacterium Barb7]
MRIGICLYGKVHVVAVLSGFGFHRLQRPFQQINIVIIERRF